MVEVLGIPVNYEDVGDGQPAVQRWDEHCVCILRIWAPVPTLVVVWEGTSRGLIVRDER